MTAEPGHDERGRPATSDELYEDAPCAHLSTCPDGTITRVNRTFIAWLGHPAEAVVGTRFQTFLTVGSRIYYETHYSPLLQMQGFVNEIALEIRLANGQIRPVVASARQIRDAQGTVTENQSRSLIPPIGAATNARLFKLGKRPSKRRTISPPRTGGRTISSPCSPTSCEILWHRFAVGSIFCGGRSTPMTSWQEHPRS